MEISLKDETIAKLKIKNLIEKNEILDYIHKEDSELSFEQCFLSFHKYFLDRFKDEVGNGSNGYKELGKILADNKVFAQNYNEVRDLYNVERYKENMEDKTDVKKLNKELWDKYINDTKDVYNEYLDNAMVNFNSKINEKNNNSNPFLRIINNMKNTNVKSSLKEDSSKIVKVLENTNKDKEKNHKQAQKSASRE